MLVVLRVKEKASISMGANLFYFVYGANKHCVLQLYKKDKYLHLNTKNDFLCSAIVRHP